MIENLNYWSFIYLNFKMDFVCLKNIKLMGKLKVEENFCNI